MAWFGEIREFKQVNDTWFCVVEYYDDATETIRLNRSFVWPLGTTKNQALGDIRAKGAELRNTSTINTSGIVGTIVPIP